MATTFDSIIENYNHKNEFVTKIWVWIAIISIFGIVILTQPIKQNNTCNTVTSNKNEIIKFPVIDIEIPANSFTVVFILVLAGLIIRWVEAFHRSFTFRQKVIEPILKKEKIMIDETPIDPRSLIDDIVYSATTSVWGLVPDFKENNNDLFNEFLRKVIYLLLKFVVIISHFVLPGLAILFVAFFKLDSTIPFYIKIPTEGIAIIASVAIIFTMITEIKYMVIAWKNQLNKK